MGKRELLIISGFALAGMLAYALTAGPAARDRPGFSLSSLVASFRRDARGGRASATVQTRGTIDIDAAITDLRLSGISKLTVTGDASRGITYELAVTASGASDMEAREAAARTTLNEDRLGSVLAISGRAPAAARQTTALSLTVPARLRIWIEAAAGASEVQAAGLAGVDLDNLVGDVRLARITGGVTGSHRNGDLSVQDAGSVDLSLSASKVTIESVKAHTTLSARNGRLRIVDARGPVEVDAANLEVSLVNPAETVRVRGTGGAVTIAAPVKPVTIDMRRAAITVTLPRAAAITALTTDQPLRLFVPDDVGLALDAAAADGGRVTADDFSIVAVTIEGQSRIRHAFNGGTIPVALRNQRGEIVIGRMK